MFISYSSYHATRFTETSKPSAQITTDFVKSTKYQHSNIRIECRKYQSPDEVDSGRG